MTEQEARRRLREECYTNDIEFNHSRADQILCEFLTDLGYFDLVEDWEKVEKWYD